MIDLHDMPAQLIALNAPSRAGKDTFFRGLSARCSRFSRVALGDGVRAAALAAYPGLKADFEVIFRELADQGIVDVEAGSWDWLKANRPGVVDDLIRIGEGMRRFIHPDVWWWRAKRRVEVNLEAKESVVFTDVRNPVEIYHIASMTAPKYQRIFVTIHNPSVQPIGIDSQIQEALEENPGLLNPFIQISIQNTGTPEFMVDQFVEQWNEKYDRWADSHEEAVFPRQWFDFMTNHRNSPRK